MAGMRESFAARTRWDESGEQNLDREPFPDINDYDGWTQSKRPVSILVRTIEGQVIPSLVRAHQAQSEDDAETPAADEVRPTEDDVVELTKILLEEDATAASVFANAVLDRGVSYQTLCLELFAPAARRLGEMWVADVCDFAQVTIGVGRLQQLLREFARQVPPEPTAWVQGRRALLAPTPGEQHTFGMLVVGEFFRRAGWDVTGEPAATRQELCSLVDNEWFAVVGLSLSAEAQLGRLSKVIRFVREASRNDHIHIIVGGRVFTERPELVERVGADVSAVDGRDAVERAEALLAADEAAD